MMTRRNVWLAALLVSAFCLIEGLERGYGVEPSHWYWGALMWFGVGGILAWLKEG